jgi:hypothetical protein
VPEYPLAYPDEPLAELLFKAPDRATPFAWARSRCDYPHSVRTVSFMVDAPPPTRHDPGRCADRFSPNALSLFRAVASYVSAHREDLPIRHRVKS